MRILLLTFSLLVCFIYFQNSANAGDRKVLVERYTSSTCGPCASQNPNLDGFLSSANPDKVTSISYHMNWPAPGNDPMYLANPSDNTTRRNVYGVNSIPNWWFDGQINLIGGSLAACQSAFDQRTNILSPVTIVVSEVRNGSLITVKADVYCEAYVSNPNAIVHIAVVQDHLQYPSPPGTNGESMFHDVMRRMLPNAAGTPISLIPGRKITVEQTYTADASWDLATLKHVVFVQGTTPLEIYNAAEVTTDFNFVSSPSYKTVNQGQSQDAMYHARIPSVAQGYNSPVTVTAEPLVPVAGLSAMIMGSNVISNFSDSVAVHVSSTSAVPVGEYQIVITGTSASGKVHKTIINYLVGKNYCVIGPNRPSINFKVDGTQYNSPVVFVWDLSSSHNLEALSPQTTGNYRYTFANWSNGGTQSQTINVNTTTSNYTANYNVSYRLLGQTSPAGLPVTITGSGVYYDSASVNNISVSATQVTHNGKTYVFQGWTGTGQGSYTGPNPSAQVTNHGVIVQTANFDTLDVGISNYNTTIPDKFELYQNYPNPFNPSTTIKFDIPQATTASLIVFDVVGKEIARLVDQKLSPGSYQYTMNADNFASGIYYYQIKTESFTQIRKMILLK